MEDDVQVCDRCGSKACVGKDLCEHDHKRHGVVMIPKYKADREAPRPAPKSVKGGK